MVDVSPGTCALLAKRGNANGFDSPRCHDLYGDACFPPDLSPPPEDLTTPTTRPGEVATRTGTVQFSLRWSTIADLDLAVTDPLGATVSFNSREVSSGGELDVDANAGCGSATESPIENIIWPGDAPAGVYTIRVTYFSQCGSASAPQNFEVTANVGGEETVIVPAVARPALTGRVNGG